MSNSYDCLKAILSGQVPEEEIITLLDEMSNRGETVNEIVGFAKAMREKAIPLHLTDGPLLDVCGTGGSGKTRFNISTTVAFLLAALGVNVAKHGNYGSKLNNGSFNFLESLGIPIQLNSDQQQALFGRTNLCFLFARAYHPAMRYVGPARQKLGKRTIFNVIGPLCNPAKNTHQLIGTTNKETAEKLAQALQQLGIQKALVCVGGDGLDELSLTGENQLWEVTPSSIKTHRFQYQGDESADYNCGDADTNAQLFLSLLDLPENHPSLAAHIALNAGAGLWCMGNADSLEEGMTMALDAIKDKTLKRYYETFKQEGEKQCHLSK